MPSSFSYRCISMCTCYERQPAPARRLLLTQSCRQAPDDGTSSLRMRHPLVHSWTCMHGHAMLHNHSVNQLMNSACVPNHLTHPMHFGMINKKKQTKGKLSEMQYNWLYMHVWLTNWWGIQVSFRVENGQGGNWLFGTTLSCGYNIETEVMRVCLRYFVSICTCACIYICIQA